MHTQSRLILVSSFREMHDIIESEKEAQPAFEKDVLSPSEIQAFTAFTNPQSAVYF